MCLIPTKIGKEAYLSEYYVRRMCFYSAKKWENGDFVGKMGEKRAVLEKKPEK